MWISRLGRGLAARTAILALLYILTGKLGLLLAVPPGYATVIWPASGLAVGMLLVYGPRLWGGVLIGSFVLNLLNSHGVSLEGGVDGVKVLTALGIAVGSTVQALVGRWRVARFVGLPLALNGVRGLLTLMVLSGPLACLIAASVGTGTLLAAGIIAPSEAVGNWTTWWLGDVLGVFVFMPLVLAAPGNPHPPTWRGRLLARLSVLTALVLIVPLALTFYAWKITSETVNRQGQADFAALTAESEDALRFRMTSYDYALLGAGAYYQGKEHLTRADWRNYVSTLNIRNQFPGINGIGVILPIEPDQRDALVARMQADGATDFEVHPEAPGRPLNIITYIEPIELNGPALGLNVGFEDNRLEAADISRRTGAPTITRKIILVQDDQHTPGFLMMRPVYKAGAATQTAEQRSRNLRAWIYAPFIARNLLARLTNSQGRSLEVRLYDGATETADSLIYDSADARHGSREAAYTVRRPVTIMHQTWQVVWSSTPAFEKAHRSDQPLMVLVGGLLFTGLFGMFVILGSVRTTASMEWLLRDQKYAAPILVFLIAAGGAVYLYDTANKREEAFVRDGVREQADKVALLVSMDMRNRLQGLKRMGLRWEVAGGTSEVEWRADSDAFIEQFSGLRAVQWIDDSHHVRWVQPLAGNESVIGLDIQFDKARTDALSGAASRSGFTITPPLDLVQGYQAIIAYMPLRREGRFTGFLAAVFETDDLFEAALAHDVSDNYAVTITGHARTLYENAPGGEALVPDLTVSREIRVADTVWQLSVTPTAAVVRSQSSFLPIMLLFGGIMIAALLALTMRAILLTRVKSAYLVSSNQLNDAILSSSAYLIIATDRVGTVVLFNRAAEVALGYDASELVGTATPAIWHDPREVVSRARSLGEELGFPVEPGFPVFTLKAERDGVESRQWTYVRKGGDRFPVNLSVTPLRDLSGKITGYLGVAENVTERLEQQKALQDSEETFRAAMEYAPIGMGLGSLVGGWLKVSPSLCELFGYSRAELLRSDIHNLSHEDDLAASIELRRQVLAGEITSYQTEKRYYHSSGRIIWALVNAALVRDADGAPKYFIIQVQDITDRKAMDRIKSEFISVVSHELRTPLTSIRGSLGLIVGTMARDLPAAASRLLQIASNNCERLILLINDILDIDKLASGQMRFNVQAHQVAWLVAQAVEANTAYAGQFNVALAVEPIDHALQVEVDADRLIQVLSNLLSNAAKFSPNGETVTLSAAATTTGLVRIAVTDLGPGITPEFRQQIFDKFSQSDSSMTRARGGTGLGLHISRQIVDHMGGEIGFDTEVGSGSTFWIEVPAVAVDGPDIADEAHAVDDRAVDPRLPRILHVEDDADFSQFLAAALHGRAELVTATSVRQAVRLVAEQSFALVVLDIGLPDGDGLSLLPVLRDRDGGAIPVAILTAAEIPDSILPDVAVAMVKSRLSEAHMVEAIVSLIGKGENAAGEIDHD